MSAPRVPLMSGAPVAEPMAGGVSLPAVHEAGHAVVALLRGVPIRYARIGTDPDDFGGVVQLVWPLPAGVARRDWAAVAWGGVTAEAWWLTGGRPLSAFQSAWVAGHAYWDLAGLDKAGVPRQSGRRVAATVLRRYWRLVLVAAAALDAQHYLTSGELVAVLAEGVAA